MAEIDLSPKNAIVLGVADEKSLAYTIAKKLGMAGANLIIGYQLRNEAKITHIRNEINADFLPFDVMDDDLSEEFFKQVSERFGKIDYLVHSIAFTKRETLKGSLVDTTKEN